MYGPRTMHIHFSLKAHSTKTFRGFAQSYSKCCLQPHIAHSVIEISSQCLLQIQDSTKFRIKPKCSCYLLHHIQRALFYILTLFTSENFTLLPTFTTSIRRHFREAHFLFAPLPPPITNVVYLKTSIFCSLEVLMRSKSFVYYMKRNLALH